MYSLFYIFQIIIFLLFHLNLYSFHFKSLLGNKNFNNLPIKFSKCYLSETNDYANKIILNENIENIVNNKMKQLDIMTYMILPITSLIFPQLLTVITDSTLSSRQRQVAIIALLISKRIYIYSWAYSTISTIAYRSISLPSGFGQRTKLINEELTRNVFNSSILWNKMNQNATIDDGIYEEMDKTSPVILVSSIPIILTISILSAFTISNFKQSDLLPTISTWINGMSTFLVCFLFSKVEIQRIVEYLWKDSKFLSIGASLIISSLAFISGVNLWPLHNIVNSHIATNVSRLFQFPELKWIIALLSLLVAYDVFFVNGSQIFTDGGTSIMDSIARSKLAISSTTPSFNSDISSVSQNILPQMFQSWRPGLFEVSIGGKISDALGLGDVVFPGILAGWALRSDFGKSTNENNDTMEKPLFDAFMIGLIISFVMLEVFQTGQGQPALEYIVPSVLISMFLKSIIKKN